MFDLKLHREKCDDLISSLCDYDEFDIDKNGFIEKISKEKHFLFFIHNGFPCIVLRNQILGYFCGYVGVPNHHHYYNVDYNEMYENDKYHDLEVHWGVNFSSKFHISGSKYSKYSDYYYYGFDCGRSGDLTPVNITLNLSFGDDIHQYKDIEYVKNEIKSLADQLACYNKDLVVEKRGKRIKEIYGRIRNNNR